MNALLERIASGDLDASNELFEELYPELLGMARRVFSSQRKSHTLQPTALVGEAFIKMARPGAGKEYADRAHFLAVAAQAMRQILVNHARDRGAEKRGGGQARERVTLSGLGHDVTADELDALAVHDALEALAAIDERQAKVAEMRFFGGMTSREAAAALGISLRSVELDWTLAKRFLAERLREDA